MDPVEKAIRSALEKGDAQDRTFREKVYRSAFAALERSTQSNPQLTVEMAIKRRQNLQARITSIEAEYVGPQPLPVGPEEIADVLADAVEIQGNAAPVPSVDETPRDSGRGAAAPPVGIDAGTPAGHAPSVDIGATTAREVGEPDFGTPDIGVPVRGEPPLAGTPAATVAPDRDERRARRRRPFAAMFMILTLLCIAAIGGWWGYQTGLFDFLSSPRVASPPQLVEEDDFDPGPDGSAEPGDLGGSQELRNWITVFSPGDPSGVNAPTGATADVSQDESGSFIRIRSGSDGADVIFDVGQGVLEQIAGKKAVFDVSARAEDGQQTQISISCDFGEMGDCGRKRYAVGYERGEYLFDVALPANKPGAGGSIAINSDFANEGKAVDIYEIKVSVVE
ncbi:hypothetical protein ABMA32_05955 [Mesorhizobium sp. VNQ89]|uniref:hypothetical protein n=1 Tax=Mesorhizobium quangtriensis TaxID=3157709 RepID=UPI0032B73FBB